MSIFDTNKTRYISHRGFTPLAPENSLPSFYYAGVFGQWAIETDLHITCDGKTVCCHNDKIDAYCNGIGKISEMSYSKLCRFKIINGNRADCFEDEELKIPSFAEYLSICKKFGSVPFIELKTDDVEHVIYDLHKNGFSDSEFIISSIKLSRLIEARRYSDDIFLHWIFAEKDNLKEFCELKNAGVSYDISDPFNCNEKLISLSHSMGLKVCLRAADNLSSLEQMKKLGVDYFPTNKMHDKK